ncbi:ATP-dependent DNA helicase [Trichonephila clavata]|uniref:ATP-dependent DNA helicase n=1 Tax=Trichonephila clavata TaxID=2740835 RepID=A0A8X6GAH2_TRICU|nr:ATP-dependent DNA helicase [Trichonephila clavata]
MRSHIQGDLSAGQFANKLLQIGDGKAPEDPSTCLIIMPWGQIINSPDERLPKVYPNILQNFKDQHWLSHRAILASRNDVVEKLNVTIQKQLPGKEYAYKSIDCILNDDEAVQYPIEFLNSIQTPDLQAPNLILKMKKKRCSLSLLVKGTGKTVAYQFKIPNKIRITEKAGGVDIKVT